MSESTVDESQIATIEDVLQLLVAAVAQHRREIDDLTAIIEMMVSPPDEGGE
jgi:uncharacterized coiled-coil protein SlyX